MKSLLFIFILYASGVSAQVFISGGMNVNHPNFYYAGAGYTFYNNTGNAFKMLPSIQFECTYNRYKYRADYRPYIKMEQVQQFLRLSPSLNVGIIQRREFSLFVTLGADYALHIDKYGDSGFNPRAEVSIGYSSVLLRGSAIVPTAAMPDFNAALQHTDFNIGIVVFLFLTDFGDKN